jgi:hypothetical protein
MPFYRIYKIKDYRPELPGPVKDLTFGTDATEIQITEQGHSYPTFVAPLLGI